MAAKTHDKTEEKTLTIETIKGKQYPVGEQWEFMLAMVQGSEGISMPFCYDVTLYRPEVDSTSTPMPEIDASALINTAATIGIRIDTGQWIYRTGIIASIAKSGTTNVRHEGQTNFFVYNARIVPAFKMLDNEITFRVFEKMNLKQIIQEVIKNFPGIDSDKYVNFGQLTDEDLPKLEYCVQFGESSFNFLSRLMAQHGIWYMFEHRQTSGDAVNETMVLGKQISYVNQCTSDQLNVVLYDADENDIAAFSRSYQPAHHHVSVGDFNELMPTVPIGADTDVEPAYDLQPNEPKTTSRFRLDCFPCPVLNEAGNGIQTAADQDANAIIRGSETGVFLAQGQTKNRTFMAGRAFQIKNDHTGAAGRDKNYLIAALSFTAFDHSYGHSTGWDIINLIGDMTWKFFASDGNKPAKKVINVFAGLSAQGLNNYLQNEGAYAFGHKFYRNSGIQNNGNATKPWFLPFFVGGVIAAGATAVQTLVDRIDHIFDRHDNDYGNAFIAIPWNPAKGFWRFPLPMAASAVVNGPHLAVVIGQNGTDPKDCGHIYTDDDGRVRIRFAWQRTVPKAGEPTAPVSPGSDTDPQKSDRRTCWVRVSEAWAGPQYGSQFLPRIGDEVIVSFIDGDPNRPIITGRVYNGVSQHPWKPKSARSGIKTQTTPKPQDSGQKFHMLRFDDTPSKEQLLMRSQGRLDITALGSRFETIGNDRHLTVGWIDTEHKVVGGNYFNKVFQDYHLHVGDPMGPFNGGHRFEEVEKTYELHVKDNMSVLLRENLWADVRKDVTVNADQIIFEATSKISFKVGNNFVVITPAGVAVVGTQIGKNSGGEPEPAPMVAVADVPDPILADDGTK